jgi:DNA-binding IclR family transcriptional regulator
MSSDGTGTVVRVINLLRCLAEAEGDMAISDISKRLGLAPSTVHRLLQLLVDEDIVAKNDARALYRPGLEMARIAALISSKVQLQDLARPVMEKLTAATQEASLLTELLPHELEVMVTASTTSPHPLRYDIEMFQRSSLLLGATGLTILAFLPADKIEQALERADEEPVRGKRIRKPAIVKALEQIRARGHAITRGEKVPGAVGIGAPVFDGQGRVVAGLSITMPEQRFDLANGDELAALVMAGAKELSALQGYIERGAK